MGWQQFDGAPGLWNEHVNALTEGNLFQTYEWGECKSGWVVSRFICSEGQSVKTVVQILSKRFSSLFALTWVPGGACGDLQKLDDEFHKVIKRHLHVLFCYTRMSWQHKNASNDETTIQNLGWKRPSIPMLSGLSMEQTPSSEFNLSECSSNWRHNYKRSLKNKLQVEVWKNPRVEDMLHTYAQMQKYKNLEAQFQEYELKAILKNLEKNLIICRAVNESGQTVALRGAAVSKNKAWDLFAAATPDARKTYVTYLLYRILLEECAKIGVVSYDLGGVDPQGNAGVYNFKKGTGASLVHYFGEWEWASHKLVSYLCNWIIYFKLGRSKT